MHCPYCGSTEYQLVRSHVPGERRACCSACQMGFCLPDPAPAEGGNLEGPAERLQNVEPVTEPDLPPHVASAPAEPASATEPAPVEPPAPKPKAKRKPREPKTK